jgi:hypothetical protein
MCPADCLDLRRLQIEPGKRLGAARSAFLKAGAQAVGLVGVAEVTAIWATPSNTTTALRAEMTILGGVREAARSLPFNEPTTSAAGVGHRCAKGPSRPTHSWLPRQGQGLALAPGPAPARS